MLTYLIKSEKVYIMKLKDQGFFLCELEYLSSIGDRERYNEQVKKTYFYEKIQSITDLDASGLGESNADIIPTLIEIAATSNSLKTIDLSNNHFDPAGFLDIFKTLLSSTSLRKMTFYDLWLCPDEKEAMKVIVKDHNCQLERNVFYKFYDLFMAQFLPIELVSKIMGHCPNSHDSHIEIEV